MFCHSLPKVALVKSIYLVKTKKIHLVNMMGGCGWKNVILSQDLNLQFFFEAKNENLCQDLNPGQQKSYFCSPVLYHWAMKFVLLNSKFLYPMISLIIDMKCGKVKVEKTENHEFIGKFSLNLAIFDKTLFYTSHRPK